jgi:5-(carboxyamino)imidazole ribonucleotide synthase
MTKVGILGAGQLGRMLALAGYPLGMQFRFFDPVADSPADPLAENMTADYMNTYALDRFANGLDVITYEFENVPVDAVRYLERSVPVYPPPLALEKGQDRFVEKSFFRGLGIPVPQFGIETDAISFPSVVKTRRMGYDGKGQAVLSSSEDIHSQAVSELLAHEDLIVEEFISFDRELSIIAVRNKSGETAFYPLAENHHVDGILRKSLVTGQISSQLQEQAEKHAEAVMNALNYVGVLAIEFFEKDGQLLANEMAPRVHNSGHWTIDGAVTSQFENHLRAVSDAPLGSTDPLGVCAMVNLIGNAPDVDSILKIAGAHLHLYGKEPRPKRKLGHVTFVEKDMKTLQNKLDRFEEIHHDA